MGPEAQPKGIDTGRVTAWLAEHPEPPQYSPGGQRSPMAAQTQPLSTEQLSARGSAVQSTQASPCAPHVVDDAWWHSPPWQHPCGQESASHNCARHSAVVRG